jgi:hypothetical protein
MSVDVSLGEIYWKENLISVSQQTLTLDNSGSLGRIDLILINSAGNCSILKGTESIEPLRQSNYDISSYYCLGVITVGSLVASINSANINDKRVILKLNEESENKKTSIVTSTETEELKYPFSKLKYIDSVLLYDNTGTIERLVLDSNNKIEYITGISYDYIKGTSNLSKTDFVLLSNNNFSQVNDKTKLGITGFSKLTNPIKEIKANGSGVRNKATVTDVVSNILITNGIMIFQNTGNEDLYLGYNITTISDGLLLKPNELVTIYINDQSGYFYYTVICDTGKTTTLNYMGFAI